MYLVTYSCRLFIAGHKKDVVQPYVANPYHGVTHRKPPHAHGVSALSLCVLNQCGSIWLHK